MPYFRVQWQGANGIRQFSDPLPTWIAAQNYRAELIISGKVAAPCYARVIDYAPAPLRTLRTPQGLTWTYYPNNGGMPSRVAGDWCADGDGMLTVRCIGTARVLYDQCARVRRLPDDDAQALQHATDYLRAENPEMFDFLVQTYEG